RRLRSTFTTTRSRGAVSKHCLAASRSGSTLTRRRSRPTPSLPSCRWCDEVIDGPMKILIAGVDEAGRGPLAGPVVAAAVILDPDCKMRGLRDSKTLTASERERLAIMIRAEAIAWAVGSADVAEIDALNILQASMLAMRRAVAALSVEIG